ncbi:MAG TPA: hypothetical protein PKK41_07090 [Methanoculleus sp.]|nr:hypothetical protein [Methanoculleus sp.]
MDDLQFGLSARDLLDRADNVAKEGLAERAALVKTVAPERLADDAVVEDEVDERLAVLFDDVGVFILGFPDLEGVLPPEQVGELVERSLDVIPFLEVLGDLVAELLSGAVGDGVCPPPCDLFE